MHDGRPGLEVVELADDRFGIALGAAAPGLRPHAFAEQLLLADDRDPRIGQHHAVLEWRDGDANPLSRSLELRPAIRPHQVEMPAGQQVMDLFTASCRVACEKDAPCKVIEELHQGARSVFVARFHLHCRR